MVKRIATYDVGSLPIEADSKAFEDGAKTYLTVLPLLQKGVEHVEHAQLFERICVQAFVDKLNSGIDIPNYVQLRDMNTMFLDMISGIVKKGGSYLRLGHLSLSSGSRIPEVEAIRRNASTIRQKSDAQPIRIKVCITGPYTLSTLFDSRDASLFLELGNTLAQLVSNTIFQSSDAETALISVDEPVFGFLNDPLLDEGAEGRECLLKAWEVICEKASSKRVLTSFHLHNTTDQLFWSVKDLRIVEAHTQDPIYLSDTTKKRLEDTDKQLKASLCITDFDRLIIDYLTAQHRGTEQQLQEELADTWRSIKARKTNSLLFLEDKTTMEARLNDRVARFGEERVPYAGPECGFRSFPSYDTALECLSRISQAVANFEKRNEISTKPQTSEG